ncbi:MAG: DUF6585 family protein [bacterium]|nr:DUF6585 family protein [bacterium]
MQAKNQFKFPGTTQNQILTMALLLTLGTFFMIPGVLLLAARFTRDNPPDDAYLIQQLPLMIFAVISIGFALRFFLRPRWKKKGAEFVLRHNSLQINEEKYSWERLTLLSFVELSQPPRTTLQLFEGERGIFILTRVEPLMSELIQRLREKIEETQLPQLIERWQQGETLRFGNLTIHQTQLLQNDQVILLDEAKSWSQDEDGTLSIRDRNGRGMGIIFTQWLPNGFLLLPLLDAIKGESKDES